MGGGPLSRRRREAPFLARPEGPAIECGINGRFQPLSPAERQVIHLVLTRSPLYSPLRVLIARLACMKPAASVRSEPGSNSPIINPTERGSVDDEFEPVHFLKRNHGHRTPAVKREPGLVLG